MLSFKPHLPKFWSHKLSTRPACCAAFVGGVHNDLSLIPAFRRMYLASEGFVWHPPVLLSGAVLKFVGQHGFVQDVICDFFDWLKLLW